MNNQPFHLSNSVFILFALFFDIVWYMLKMNLLGVYRLLLVKEIEI